jgi:ribosomal-protein-alanine N-acetyltransferase
MQNVITQIDNNDTIFWIITLNGDTKIAGCISLWKLDKERHRGEVGYTLDTIYHNKGIMTEALALVLDYGFNTMKLEVIEAYTHRENIASRRMLERKGFVRNPELEAQKVGITDPETSVIYTLNKGQQFA